MGQPDVWLYDRLTGGSLHTGQGGFATKVGGDWTVFTTGDFRLGAYRISTGTATLFPTYAYTNDAWSGNRRFVWDQNAVFMHLDEYFGGTDQDGDGKLTVSVGHLSLTTLQARKLAIGTPLGIHGSRVIFYNDLAPMWGEPADYGLKLYDLATDQVTPLGLQVGSAAIFGNVIAFTASEAWVGQDLNGDGDTADWVLGYAALRSGP
jgi:hypothetical protein